MEAWPEKSAAGVKRMEPSGSSVALPWVVTREAGSMEAPAASLASAAMVTGVSSGVEAVSSAAAGDAAEICQEKERETEAPLASEAVRVTV